MPDEECVRPGSLRYSDKEAAAEPIKRRAVIEGKDFEAQLCPCGWYHIVEVTT
jgi:hypothetical protein